MATLNEIAKGIAEVLSLGGLRNLPVDLWGDTPDETVLFVHEVINECFTRKVKLKSVRVDIKLAPKVSKHGDILFEYRGIIVKADKNLRNRVEFICDAPPIH